MTRRRAGPALLLALVSLTPASLAGQVPDSLQVDSVRPVPQQVPPGPAAVDSLRETPISPGGAMIRSMLLPGWGQSAFESYFRGGIYFAGWAGNGFMIFRNAYRLEDVRTRFGIRTDQVEQRLVAGSSNPDSMQSQIDSFPDILDTAIREDSLGNELRKLVRSRRQQQEDWIAWSLFWVLASGIDAYVTAHLSDFPAEIELRPQGRGSVSLRVGVPLGPGPRPASPQGAAKPRDGGT